MNPDITSLTLEQKASLLSGKDFWSTKSIGQAGIPSIVLTDGPHGIRRQEADSDHLGLNGSLPATCFPPAVAVGNSWDPEVAAQVGAAVGREARAFGVSVVLGPGVNIKRSPLCGRNFEYYSEDPLLSGALGAAHVTALQATGPGASLKHFAANNQETERMRISSEVDERTLREIYFPAFERVVTQAQPATVMCSYNKLNGTYASHNKWLLTEVLRNDWGFKGAVVSDWGAVSDRVAGVAAGMDLEMPGSGGSTDQQIIDAVHDGRLTEEEVDDAVRRVVALTRLPREASNEVDVQAHHTIARHTAAQSIVLLKNDAALPLLAGQRIAVVGPFAVQPRFQGGGSSHVNPTETDCALDELTVLAQKCNAMIDYAPGYSLDDADPALLRSEAINLATASDVAVIFAGLSDREESEGYDRTRLELPANQVELIRAVAAVAAKTVVVLSNGGVLTLEEWHDDVDAIVESWLLGQASGGAIADVLFGAVNPSGRLAETIPLRLEDNPSWLNFPGEQGHVRYSEGVFVGYRYYTTAGVKVRYPFGHGLSYTTFTTSGLKAEAVSDDSVKVTATITNTGVRAGKHVMQVYVATTAGPVRRPLRELRGFAKVQLEAGESKSVTLDLDRRAFAYWDIELDRWIVPAGDYTIQICADASTVLLEEELALVGDKTIRELTLESTVGDWFAHPAVGASFQAKLSQLGPGDAADQEANADAMKMVESMPMQQFLAFLNGAISPDEMSELMELSKHEPALH